MISYISLSRGYNGSLVTCKYLLSPFMKWGQVRINVWPGPVTLQVTGWGLSGSVGTRCAGLIKYLRTNPEYIFCEKGRISTFNLHDRGMTQRSI